jgi:hypothetical protein
LKEDSLNSALPENRAGHRSDGLKMDNAMGTANNGDQIIAIMAYLYDAGIAGDAD